LSRFLFYLILYIFFGFINGAVRADGSEIYQSAVQGVTSSTCAYLVLNNVILSTPIVCIVLVIINISDISWSIFIQLPCSELTPVP